MTKSEASHQNNPGYFHQVVDTISNLWLVTIFLKLWSVVSLLLIPQLLLTTKESTSNQKCKSIKKKSKKTTAEVPNLFPSISNNENITSSMDGKIKPCSTGLTTKLLPFKNKNGEIEWAFTEDMSANNELDSYHKKDETLTPITSSSSNNDSNAPDLTNNFNHDSTPTSNSSSPFSPDSGNKNEEDGKVHQCPHCDATFKIRGYLTRHLKKHAVKKAYSCPFHNFSIYIDENNITHKCHPNGGFSRRDTYKTHLKSRHFKYPKGTKTKERSNSPGNCSMCGEYFENSEIWCEIHVEGGECKFLPKGFKGKSRIKNRLRKQLSKKFKEDEINDSTVNAAARAAALAFTTNGKCNIDDYDHLHEHHSISSSSSSQDLHNDYNTPVFDTPTSMNSNTPMPNLAHAPTSTYPAHSPTLSNTSHPQMGTNSTSGQYESPIQQIPHQQQHQQVQNLQHQYQNQVQPQIQQAAPPQYSQVNPQMQYQPPLFDQFNHHYHVPVAKKNSIDDYDDEFCLDIEQLNYGDGTVNDLLGYLKNHETDLVALNTFLSNEIASNNNNNNNHISIMNPNISTNYDENKSNNNNSNVNYNNVDYSKYMNNQIYNIHPQAQAQAQTQTY